jgi:hypothetical protein
LIIQNYYLYPTKIQDITGIGRGTILINSIEESSTGPPYSPEDYLNMNSADLTSSQKFKYVKNMFSNSKNSYGTNNSYSQQQGNVVKSLDEFNN